MVAPVALVIDDEAQMRRFLRAGLAEGFAVFDAATGADGLHLASHNPVDVLIVDLSLPDLDGAEIVQRVRVFSAVPIVMLSVGREECEIVSLLKLGADDYVIKPCSMSILVARASMSRRVACRGEDPVVLAGELIVDFAARAVTVKGNPILLATEDYTIVQELAQHAGNVVTQEHLLKAIGRAAHAEEAHGLRVLMRRLRGKIERVVSAVPLPPSGARSDR